MWLATRYGIPALREHLGGPDVLCWFVAGGSVFACLFVGAFIAFWTEKGRVSLHGLAQRYRFRKIHRFDLLWSVGVFLACSVLSAVILTFWTVASWSFGLVPEPDLSPPFVKMEPLTAETVWVLLAWLPLFFLNIAGEELWWRGFILPRQEQTHGMTDISNTSKAIRHQYGMVSSMIFYDPANVKHRLSLYPG